MAQGKTVIVLGGGIGGTVAANRPRTMLPDEHRVIWVEREAAHVSRPSAEITSKGAPHASDGQGECFIEIGDRKAGFGSGNFDADPVPELRLRRPSTARDLGMIGFGNFRLSGRL